MQRDLRREKRDGLESVEPREKSKSLSLTHSLTLLCFRSSLAVLVEHRVASRSTNRGNEQAGRSRAAGIAQFSRERESGGRLCVLGAYEKAGGMNTNKGQLVLLCEKCVQTRETRGGVHV
jgi:hypothetical protein